MQQLFAFGSNGKGQLGVVHRDDVRTPTPCDDSTMLCAVGPYSVATGGNHTLLLDAEMILRVAGNVPNGAAALGNLLESTVASTFRQVAFKDNETNLHDHFQHVSATWEASTFVSSSGNVYTAGNGTKGELGQGSSVTRITTPMLLKNFPPLDTHIVDLHASMSHTVAVLSNGEIHGWGSGRKGQLGQPKDAIWQPRRLDGIAFRAQKVVCGRDFTLVVGDANAGEFAILGDDKHGLKSSVPEAIPDWKQVGATWGSIFVLFHDGTLLSWGRNDHGQLGPSDLPLIDSFVTGSEHVLAKTVDGRIVAWGWGEHGNCGPNPTKGVTNIITEGPEWCLAGAGCATSFIAHS